MSPRQLLVATLCLSSLGITLARADLIKSIQPVQPATPNHIAPAMTVAPGQRPLTAPLRISQVATPPSICAALKPQSDAMMTSFARYQQALSKTDEICQLPGKTVPHKLDGILYEQCCSNGVSFSVYDQQTAGCVGTDTVSACMEKLTRQCIRNQAQSMGLVDDMKKQSAAYDEISARSGELARQMRSVLMLMP